jgi:hypothetical protein
MDKKKVLFIVGSLNTTTMAHQIWAHLPEYDRYFSPYYTGTLLDHIVPKFKHFTIMAQSHRTMTVNYLKRHNLPIDYKGRSGDYDFTIMCSDLIIPPNILDNPIFLVQEGFILPENFWFFMVKRFGFHRVICDTAATGLSDVYELFFVASEGYRDLFIKRGVRPDKIRVTGIPNFDNVRSFLDNDFPRRHFVLAATSCLRETGKYENRKQFILKVRDIAAGRPILFKLHPSENIKRAIQEVEKWAPEAMILTSGNTNHMVANCDVLITRYSSVLLVGLALGKEVHADIPLEEVLPLAPIQNNGTSARRIAESIKAYLEGQSSEYKAYHRTYGQAGSEKA